MIRALHEPGNSRSYRLFAKWWLPCLGIRMVCCWSISWKGEDRLLQVWTVQQYEVYELPPDVIVPGVSLLRDNARVNTAALIRERLQDFRWKNLDHPPYSPDLAPRDFHLFTPFNEHLGGHRFWSERMSKRLQNGGCMSRKPHVTRQVSKNLSYA